MRNEEHQNYYVQARERITHGMHVSQFVMFSYSVVTKLVK